MHTWSRLQGLDQDFMQDKSGLCRSSCVNDMAQMIEEYISPQPSSASGPWAVTVLQSPNMQLRLLDKCSHCPICWGSPGREFKIVEVGHTATSGFCFCTVLSTVRKPGVWGWSLKWEYKMSVVCGARKGRGRKETVQEMRGFSKEQEHKK